MGQIDGKVAIVTGGACGIGAACARTLAREGAKVAVTDVDDASGETLVAAIRGASGDAVYLHQDVTDEARWPDIISAVEKQFGRLDVMVANAGIAIKVPIVDMTLADWRRQQAVNLEGVFLSVKYAVPAMRRSGGGSIVIMSSLAGLRGAAGLAGYCATKGGVRLFAKAAAIEHADDSIRVNSVHPGIIDTPMMSAAAEAIAGASGVNDTMERFASFHPMGRLGRDVDIANAVAFLASSKAAFMTGSELVVDGGMTAA